MRRVIGMDLHRTFAEVVFWQDGRLCWYGRVDMTRAGLEGFGRGLTKTDEVVLEATGNAMAVVRVLRPYVARVIIANPLQVKAIAHAHVKTDKIDAGVLASLHAAGFLPEVWLPDAETECRRRLVARRNQIVRHRTRVKNETHAILAAHPVPPCPPAELFNGPGRAWLARAPGRRRRDRTQDGGPRLASPRQGDRLPLGATGAGRPQAARSRAAGRPTDAERQPARPCLCL
jgi:transposase